jgi:hypothetical protein
LFVEYAHIEGSKRSLELTVIDELEVDFMSRRISNVALGFREISTALTTETPVVFELELEVSND